MGVKKAISPENRKKMFAMGVETYSSYALLDMVSSNYYVSKNKDFDINDTKISLQDYITSLVKEGKKEADFTLGKLPCHIKLTPLANKEWSVAITSPSIKEQKEPLDLKPIHQLLPVDFVKLCTKYPLVISEEKTGGYKFSAELNTDNKKLRLGGPGKLGLFQLHISNLYTILQRVKDPNTDLNMLVAMATGSGKSFTQALWFLVQYLSDNPCYFAAPSASLVAQLKRDFERLLPDSVTNNITALDENAAAATPDNPGSQWAIMSHKKLLLDHWDFLQNKRIQESGLLISIDEEHLSADEELLNKRIKKLAQQYPAMLLSATPSEESYEVTGGDPVASLSRKEKEEQGIAKPALSIHAHPQGILKKGRKNANLNLLDKLILSFVGSIEEERQSPAHEYVDQSETAVSYRPESDPFYAKPDPNALRRFMRWNIETAIGKKALVLVDRHDPVINMHLLSSGYERSHKNPYANGNRVERDSVYDFFSLGENLDNRCFNGYTRAKEDLRRETYVRSLQDKFANIPLPELTQTVNDHIDLSNTSRYMVNRVLHGLIENSLSYLMGYDSNQLDYMRFHHFDQLTNEVKHKLGDLPRLFGGGLDAAATQQAVSLMLQKDKLPKRIADEAAEAMVEVLEKLYSSNDEDRELIIDNWSVDKKLHALFDLDSWHGRNAIADFSIKHKTVFLVNGLEKSPTSIASNRPFFNLEEKSQNINDAEVKNNDALRHPLSPLEALDDTTRQAIYTPNYCPDEYTTEVVDTFFRKGFIGAYPTSEKVTGFNDLGLHHLAMLMNDKEDPINSPINVIQGLGRLRGQSPVSQPFAFTITAQNTKVGMSTEALEKKNYYPDFFEAKKVHHIKLTKRLGAKIATQMKVYLNNNLNPDGTIHTDDLQKNLHDIIIAEFEQVYKNNNFDFKKTKKIFSSVLADVYTSLYAQSYQLQRQYSLPLAARVIAAVLNFITTIYYKLAIAGSYFSFFLASRKLVKAAKTDKSLLNEATYTHIVRSVNYKDLITLGVPAKRFKSLFEDDTKKTIEYALLKVPHNHVKPENKQLLMDFFKNDLSALCVRFIGNSFQQLILLRMIAAKDHWLEKALPHAKILLDPDRKNTLNTFMLIIQDDPDIAAYIAGQNLQIYPDREIVAKKGLQTIKNKVEELLLQVESKGALNDVAIQPQVSSIFINYFDDISFLFHPKDAVFLSTHKSKINIDMAILQKIYSKETPSIEKVPELLMKLFVASLPPDLVSQAQNQSLLRRLEDYAPNNRLDEVNKKFSSLKDLFDPASIRNLLAKNMERYIKSSLLKKVINQILGPFSEEHLLTLLSAIYPDDDTAVTKNKDKVAKLMNFNKDFRKMTSQALFEKYASFEDPTDLEKTDLHQIFAWLYDLYDEILACECHWHDMDDKGEAFMSNKKSPKLREKSKDGSHAIWDKHGTTTQSFMAGISKKTLFLKGTQNSFDWLNEIEGIGSLPTIKALQETADYYVHPLRKGLNDYNPSAWKKASLHQQSMFMTAKTLGKQMRAAQSLTDAEVDSSKTTDLNAVQRLRRPEGRKG